MNALREAMEAKIEQARILVESDEDEKVSQGIALFSEIIDVLADCCNAIAEGLPDEDDSAPQDLTEIAEQLLRISEAFEDEDDDAVKEE